MAGSWASRILAASCQPSFRLEGALEPWVRLKGEESKGLGLSVLYALLAIGLRVAALPR